MMLFSFPFISTLPDISTVPFLENQKKLITLDCLNFLRFFAFFLQLLAFSPAKLRLLLQLTTFISLLFGNLTK